ncbi:hypothetical protein BGY98DRAFT_411019 [Russula aff. rugulosa BPL654]|nr:hypothetical protein BGY98DRAFT_411019 [Russula aff. rugulosa BPL654]
MNHKNGIDGTGHCGAVICRRSSIPLQNCGSIIQSTSKKNKSTNRSCKIIPCWNWNAICFTCLNFLLFINGVWEPLFKLQLLPLPVFGPTKLAQLTCGWARNVILSSSQRQSKLGSLAPRENHLRKAKFQLNSSPHPPFVFLLFFNIPRDSGGGRRPKYYRGPAYEWISMIQQSINHMAIRICSR